MGLVLFAQQGGLLEASFQRLNADGDGKLSVEEVNRFARTPGKLRARIRMAMG